MPNQMSQEMKDAVKAADAYETKKAEHGAEQSRRAEHLRVLNDARTVLTEQQDAHNAEVEAELAPLREKRDAAQAKAKQS